MPRPLRCARMNLPNRLTVGRIGLTALFVMAMLLPQGGAVMSYFPYGKTLALVIFLVAGLTDWWDGWIARRDHQETNFGALLDPVADKVLTTAAFICFIEQPSYRAGVPLVQAWMVLVIVARDFLVTGLRLVAGSQGVVLKAEELGKHKTASQMFTIIVTLAGLAVREDWHGAGPRFDVVFCRVVFGMMLVTVLLTVWSGFSYFWRNRDLVLRDA
jgi:CDP-diacylglycerol---glycerol-3-phosphate 3-phosphatidyltransferase